MSSNENQPNTEDQKKKKEHGKILDKKIPHPPTNVEKSYKTILSGGFAGMISKTCTAPLERVQMLNQTGATKSSIMRTLNQVIQMDGFIGLWKGNFANCVRIFPHKSLLFTCNDLLRAAIPIQNSSISFLTGATAGVIATAATYPIDVVRAYLSGTFDKNMNGMFKVCRLIINDSGIKGLYRGLGITLLGTVPYEGTRIGVYSVSREYIPTIKTKYGNEPHPIGKLVAGATAGAAAGFVTYPSDTIRRMLQVQGADGMKKYSGVINCIIDVWKTEGITRFYSGLSAKLVRVVPDAAILFLAYEGLKNYFEDIYFGK